MKLKKCFQCNKEIYTPVHITEIAKDKSVYHFDLCQKCGETFYQIDKKKIDVSHITTPEQLLQFISGVSHIKKPNNDTPPCPQCGWTRSRTG